MKGLLMKFILFVIRIKLEASEIVLDVIERGEDVGGLLEHLDVLEEVREQL